MSVPAIAFVVPAHNAAPTLPDTLEGLRRQTLGDWECVVVDDGSTDATPAIACAFGDERVRLVRQDNRGLGAARNRGLAAARARAVCFLDADDRVHPAFAERMTGALGDRDLVACGHRYVGPALEDLGWASLPGEQDTRLAGMLSVNPFVVGAVVVRRDASARLGLGGAPFDESLPVHEDWDLWVRLTGAGARWAPIVAEPLFDYRIRPGSMSSDLDTMWRTGLRLIECAPADPAARAGAARRWSLRCLARAAARPDPDGVRDLLEHLGDPDERELGFLAASLRWALCREDAVGPAGVGRTAEAWRARVRSAMEPALARRVLERLDLSARDWAAMAARAVERAGAHHRVVLYGMGRNGRSLLAALRSIDPGTVVRFIDDAPGAGAPGARRIEVDELTYEDMIVVTPDDAAPILERLGPLGAATTLAALASPGVPA